MAQRRPVSSRAAMIPTITNPQTSTGGPSPAGGSSAARKRRRSPKPQPVVDTPAPAVSGAPESKQARMVALLRRPDGATIAELMTATGWMSHSVRGAISGVLKRALGLTVGSAVEDRGRVYRIAPPPVTAARAARARSVKQPAAAA